MEKQKIINDFFDQAIENFNYVGEKIQNLKKEYEKEMSTPGCTNCKKRALRKKYTILISKYLDGNNE